MLNLVAVKSQCSSLTLLLHSLFVFTVFIASIYYLTGKQVGWLTAYYDLMKGHYEIRTYGLHFPIVFEKQSMSLNKYGIAYRKVAGCVVNDFIIKFVDGYNSLMKDAIKNEMDIDVDYLLDQSIEANDIDKSLYVDYPVKLLKECNNIPVDPLIIDVTQKPSDNNGAFYKLGPCFNSLQVNLDSDKEIEKLCFRMLEFKDFCDTFPYNSLVVEVVKNDERILKQELDREFFYEERFFVLKDIDHDSKAELFTRVKFGPECSGCETYRIYKLKESKFYLVMYIFGINPDNSFIKKALDLYPEFKEKIQKLYIENSYSEVSMETYKNYVISDPWLVDSDNDGQPELIMLLEPPYSEFDLSQEGKFYLFIGKISDTEGPLEYKLFYIDLECCGASVDLLGIITTKDDRIHLLINHAFSGTSTGYPVLNIFEIQPTIIKKIGEFSGFYEHQISKRLVDIDHDGNTEIIYIKNTYWPPGTSHADIIIDYGFARFIDGIYVETDEEYDLPINDACQ